MDMALSELAQAEILLANNLERPAGVLGRLALERHIKTMYQTEIGVQPLPIFEQCTFGLGNMEYLKNATGNISPLFTILEVTAPTLVN